MDSNKLTLLRLTLTIDFEKGNDLKKEKVDAEYRPQIECYFTSKDSIPGDLIKESDILSPIIKKIENGIQITMWCKEGTLENAKKQLNETAEKEFIQIQNTFTKIKKAFENFISFK